MSDVSANLSMPYIQPSQAQKHITHNEALRQLDALVQLSVKSATQTAPAPSPIDGDRFLLATNCTGDWAGHDGSLAVFQDLTWDFHTPKTGWLAWIEDESKSRVFDGSNWEALTLQNPDQLGIQMTADDTNRLAVASPATLLTHAGAGHQLKLNKNTAADTASLLFQTNWSGRAEMGTTGSDDFEIKVSDDGATFRQSFVANASSGVVSFPSGTSGLADSAFGAGSLLTVDYSAAKGLDLITNGTGILGNNYNFPTVFSFDGQISPSLPGSFRFSGHLTGAETTTEFLAVNPNQIYRLQTYVRQEGLPGDWSAFSNGERHRQYMGIVCYDVDKNTILSNHHMRYKHGGIDSLTTLAAPLSPGDTTVVLTDSAGWNETSSGNAHRGITLFGYENSLGYVYEHYSRLQADALFDVGQVNKTTHVVSLNQSLPSGMGNPADPSGIWPAGTVLANSSAGNVYKYSFFSALTVPQTDTWFKTLNHLGGIDLSGTGVQNNFPPGTAFIKVMWLANHSNRLGGSGGFPDTGPDHKIWFAGISITPESLAAQNKVTSGTATGSLEIKVPVSDYAAGTVNLAPSGLSVEEI
ncbi:MAG: DUF2793 domain-containing protein [Rhodobacteraceae bacterium]|nr:DUF2793 domain-containing protein [Paracoccaceae bacterium]